jgi:hypothetical protein
MMMGRGWNAVRALSSAALVVGVVGTGMPASGAPQGARQVLGTLAVQGEVWTQEAIGSAHEARVPGASAALLERTRIRTGKKGAALLTLRQEGLVGLRAESRAELGARGDDGTRVQLLAGEALVRVPAGSLLTVATTTASVRAESIQTVAMGTVPPNEASIRLLPDGQTVVRVQSGTLQVEARQGAPALVRAGEQATLGEDGEPHIVAASTAAGTDTPAAVTAATGHEAGAAGIFSGDAAIAGLAAVGVVAGTLGGLGASGNLGNGGGSSSTSSDTGEGSPFHPHHPHHGHGHGSGHH